MESVVRARQSFIAAGVVWQFCVRAYWLLFFLRMTVDLGLTPLQLVMLGTAKEIAVLTMEIPTGIVADLYSRKWSVVLAFLVTGTAIAGAGVLDSFGPLLIVAALWGFGLTFRSGAEVAWLTDEVGSIDIVQDLLLRRAGLEMGAVVVGVAVATAVTIVASTGTALVVFGVVLFLCGCVLATVMPETGFQRVAGSRKDAFSEIVRDGASAVRHVPALQTLAIATVLAGFASEAVDRLYVRRLDDVGLTASFDNEVVIIAVVVVAQALLALVAVRISKRAIATSRRRQALAFVLSVQLLATGIGALVLAQVDQLGIAALGLVIGGAARRATEPVKVAWANEHAPRASRATVQSFVGQSHSLGEIVGGVILGVIATTKGVPLALSISAVVYVVSASVVARQARKPS